MKRVEWERAREEGGRREVRQVAEGGTEGEPK